MFRRFAARWRTRLDARDQRKRDQAWLATDPDIAEVLAERNRRRTEWMRYAAGVVDRRDDS